MRTFIIDGMPPGLRGPHIDSAGPCNDPNCHLCDPVRDQMRTWGERQWKHQLRKALVR